ncbi:MULTISPECIES: hypothetical protein [unclassified Chelatococcus]|uniref:hypothetical protein n=1 Tax=unclassified Chelatococcus TaxID=2638111 RepID=UPI001BCEAE24|nr:MULTISPECIES: hypothetical protein [unclassified Chelatococcus]CAH1660742.1 conserved hypothetical protein [Hyphomicrobiales bacterium]MBS7741159.1 hypothetical protein [Chelatococcus sp. HY11]MBX3545345.1 hypothetical protein [Chelatococcus sp.]MCO5077980.1 hypothetical protein [Chelatococcus sp.]CAH1683316.1 conserved hypothetical protein [Hyphomicrobiales bacterium]
MDKDGDLMVEGCHLKLTCWACPEQYDVFRDGIQVGYLRLRHGYFEACVPDENGDTVYEASPNGDGRFDDDERGRFLHEAVAAIARSLKSEQRFLTPSPPPQ